MIHAVKDGTRLGASLMSEFVMFSASSVMYLLREKPSGPLVYDSFVGEQTSNNYGLRYLNHLKTI